MHIFDWYFIGPCSISLLVGIIWNSRNIWKIPQIFPVNVPVFWLIHVDAICCAMGCGLALINWLVLALGYINELQCTLFMYTSFIPFLLGLLFYSLISIIRYWSLRKTLQSNETMDAGFCFKAIAVCVSLVLSYIIGLTIWHSKNDASWSSMIEVCRFDDQARPEKERRHFFIIPVVLFQTTSLCCDLALYRTLKSSVGNSSVSTPSSIPSKNMVPLRTTIFSGALVLGFLMISGAFTFFDNKLKHEVIFLTIFYPLMNTLRSPLTLLVTFAKHKQDMYEYEQQQSRNQRREREIAFALEERVTRNKNMIKEETIEMSMYHIIG